MNTAGLKVFKCTLCGECCRASPVTILPYEEVILRELAGMLNKPYKSRPGYRVFDRRSNVWIALSYAMELVDGKCVFLRDDNLCMINDLYKPLICRSYPYVPREIRYTIDDNSKTVFSTAEYGLSIKCPVIRDDRDYLVDLISRYPNWPQIYLPNEYKAALEFEEKRSLLLRLLSQLWMRGIVDLGGRGPSYAPVVNLYDLLRRFYPNLPYILGIDEILRKARGVIGY